MNSMKATLIGQLIGLARATDGSEHLISQTSTALIRECLASDVESESDSADLLSRVETAKRAMVPDCFLCANPCGKTAAFDLKELEAAPQDIRAAKTCILNALIHFSASAPESALYRGLIALGLDGVNADFLISIANELHP